MRLLVLSFLFLTGCGPDPGDLAAYERDDIGSVVVSGISLASARALLTQRGYGCDLASGPYVAELHETKSAPSFLRCTKKLKAETICGVRMDVVVIPKGAIIESVIIQQKDVCP